MVDVVARSRPTEEQSDAAKGVVCLGRRSKPSVDDRLCLPRRDVAEVVIAERRQKMPIQNALRFARGRRPLLLILKAAVGAGFSFRLRAPSIPGCVNLVSDAEERAGDGL